MPHPANIDALSDPGVPAYFRARWSFSLYFTTLGALAIMFTVACFKRDEIFPVAPATPWSIVLSLLVIAPLYGAPFCVRGFTLTPNKELWIHRLGWKTTIKLDHLVRVWAEPQVTRGEHFYFGNRGVFIFCGVYRSHKAPQSWAYITHPSDAVILMLPKLNYVITPRSPEAFASLARKLTGAQGEMDEAAQG